MKRKFSILLAAAMVMPTVAPTFTTLYATEVTTQAEATQTEEKQVLQISKFPYEKKQVDSQAKTVEVDIIAIVSLKRGNSFGTVPTVDEKGGYTTDWAIKGPHYIAEGVTIEVYSNPNNELMGFTTKDKTPVATATTNKDGRCTLTLNKDETYYIQATYIDPSDNKKEQYNTTWSFNPQFYTGVQLIDFLKVAGKPVDGTIQAVTSSSQPVTLQNATMQLFEGPDKEHLQHKETINCKGNYSVDLEDKKVYWVAVYGSDADGNGYSYEGYFPDAETIKEPQNLTLKPCPIMNLEANTMQEENAPLIKIYVNRNGNKCFMGTPPEKGGEIVYLLGNDEDKIDLYFEYEGKEVKPLKNPVANMTVKQYKEKGEDNWEYFEFKLS